MKMIFFIPILLMSACISGAKYKNATHKDTPPIFRKTSSITPWESFGEWLDKVCVFNVRQAVGVFDATLLATAIGVSFDDANQVPESYFIVRMRAPDKYTVDYAVKACDDSEEISVKNIIGWLQEAKVCGLSNAEELFDTFVSVYRHKQKFIRSKREVTEDEEFYYVKLPKQLGTYKIGKREGCREVARRHPRHLKSN